MIRADSAEITPEMLPLIDLTQEEIDSIIERVPGGMANIQDIYAVVATAGRDLVPPPGGQ